MKALARLSEEERTEFWACLALTHLDGVGARRRCALLRHFGSAYAAVQRVKEWGEAGVSPELGRLSGPWRERAKPEWEAARGLEGQILLWTDSRYPESLRQLPDAPAFLYARGDLALLANPGVAVVGAREASEHGLQATRRIASGLSSCGITVISGLARGVDGAAHQAALSGPGRSIGVLGCGPDMVYPPGHERLFQAMAERGLILSEFAPKTPPLVAHFPVRNRIISGLALGVLVVEARPRSGSLITARLALEQNRSIFAVAGPLTSGASEGCRDLIRQGATVVFEAEDIVRDLAPQLLEALSRAQAAAPEHREDEEAMFATAASASVRSRPRKQLSAPVRATVPKAAAPVILFPDNSREAALVDILRAHGPLHPDKVLELAPDLADAAELSSALLMLEMAGAARRLPGMLYEAL